MRQTMTTKVRLNEGKAKNCSAMRSATDCLGRSQHPSRAAVVARNAKKPQTVVFVRAAIWRISAKKSFTSGRALKSHGLRGLRASGSQQLREPWKPRTRIG
jgi:hypothetical protein